MKTSLFISLCCSVAFYSSAVQAACVTPPSCDELGFTADASKCEGSFLKCPWDLSRAACKENVTARAELPILYGDGTVSKDILDGKTPIGIVFDVENRLAMALTDVKKDGSTDGSEAMKWLNNNYYDIQSLTNCSTSEISSGESLTPITCGVDGRANTDNILACNYSDCLGAPAATAVNSYQPTGCTKDFCKKTKWFLPSLRDLQNMYQMKSALEAALTSLSGLSVASINNKTYWSSTEYDGNSVWVFYMGSGNRYYNANISNNYVRPVVYYGEQTTLCKIANCMTCVSGNSARCSTCEIGYTLSSGLCVSTSLSVDGCPANTTPQTCNGQEYCCPSGVNCYSGAVQCFMKMPNQDDGLL